MTLKELTGGRDTPVVESRTKESLAMTLVLAGHLCKTNILLIGFTIMVMSPR